ncbi:hypothetical protein ABFU06_09540 [Xanthomonas campestris pv. raphani]|uniref:hypothetical protein n=1 Tax=Xanthomonas campestris TaxID=339 RepID=UPI00388D5F79
MVKGNFAFDKVQRLPGNIGYEKFRLFAYPYLVAATASSATDFVANTDALIIDLRDNAGGDPATRRPGDPATLQPCNPATLQPCNPATRRWWRSWPAIVSTRACACTTS